MQRLISKQFYQQQIKRPTSYKAFEVFLKPVVMGCPSSYSAFLNDLK